VLSRGVQHRRPAPVLHGVGVGGHPDREDVLAVHRVTDVHDFGEGRIGQAAWFTLVAQSREDVPRIIQGVDDMFRNSGAPTKTETEKGFQLSFSGLMGNLKFLVSSISAVVVFTILLVTATTMGMNIRERTAELGVMKSLGFTRSRIVGLLVGESLMIAMSICRRPPGASLRSCGSSPSRLPSDSRFRSWLP
jgi:hypothetical protein